MSLRNLIKSLNGFFTDVAEENSAPSVSQRYSDFAAMTSGRASGAATIANVLAGPCLAPQGGLWTSVTVRVENGCEAVVQVPGITWGKNKAELSMTNGLVGRSVLPQTELDVDLTKILADAPASVSAATSLACLQLGSSAFAESPVEYVEQVEEQLALADRQHQDGGGLSVRGRVPIVAAALGTSALLSSVGLAPTTCTSFADFVATMPLLHTGAPAADDSSAQALLDSIGERTRRVPGTAVVLSFGPSFKSALKKLEGLTTPSDAGSELLLRELVTSIVALPGVAGVLVVALNGVPVPHLGVPKVVEIDSRIRVPTESSAPSQARLGLRAAVDASSLRTVSQVAAAAASASILVLPRRSPFASTNGATLAVGLRNVSIVSLRQPFSECIAYLNVLAAVGNRDFVGPVLADMFSGASEQVQRPALRKRISRRRRGTSEVNLRSE